MTMHLAILGLLASGLAVEANAVPFSVDGSTLTVVNGDVGVGTTSPTSKLTVVDGDIRISTTSGTRALYFQDGSAQRTAANNTGFYAHRNGVDQSISNCTATKVALTTERFDSKGWFDTGNSRYTPQVAGNYVFIASARIPDAGTVDQAVILAFVNKNGAEHCKADLRATGPNSQTVSTSCIAEANGTTDYFEMYFQQCAGGTYPLSGDGAATFFSGARIF